MLSWGALLGPWGLEHRGLSSSMLGPGMHPGSQQFHIILS